MRSRESSSRSPISLERVRPLATEAETPAQHPLLPPRQIPEEVAELRGDAIAIDRVDRVRPCRVGDRVCDGPVVQTEEGVFQRDGLLVDAEKILDLLFAHTEGCAELSVSGGRPSRLEISVRVRCSRSARS